jgi:hypothetical protein
VLQSEKWIPTKISPINSYVSKAKQKQKQSKMVKRLEERSLSKQPQASLNYNMYVSKAAFDFKLV